MPPVSRFLAAGRGVPLSLQLSFRSNVLANFIVVHCAKSEFRLRPFTGDIKGKLIEDDVVNLAGHAALCVAAPVFAATANADNPNLGRIGAAMWRPARQTVLDNPIRERGVS